MTYLGAYASPSDTICDKGLLNVVTVPINGGSIPSFQWYKNNVAIPGATQLKYSTTSVVTGDTFFCRMIALNVCNTPLTLYSNKIGATVLPLTPAPSVSISSVPVQPLPGNLVTFTAHIKNGGANPQVQWMRNGKDVIGATSTSWGASNLSYFDKISVRVHSSDPCPEAAEAISDSIVVNFPASVAMSPQSNFSISPNPNKGAFLLTGTSKTNESLDIQIMDIKGQTLYNNTIKQGNSFHFRVAPKQELAPGVYFLRLKGSITSDVLPFSVW